MVPSKPEDFTCPHGGFEGEEEGVFYLQAGDSVEVRDDRGRLIRGYTATAGGWLKGPLDPVAWVVSRPSPLPDRDTE